jgi:outer membrane protein TolC
VDLADVHPLTCRRWSFSVALVVVIGSSLHAQSLMPLSLRRAVDEALVHHPRILNQRDAISEAELGLRLARSAFHPKIVPNIQGSFGQTNVASQTYRVDVAQRLTSGTEVRLGAGTATSQIPGFSNNDIHFYSADTTLSVSQPLMRGFGRAMTLRSLTSAELRMADARRQEQLNEQQIALEVAAAYYRVVAQESFLGVAQQSLTRSRTLREASEAKLEAGLVSQLDVLRAQQLVLQAEMQLFDAQSAAEDARDQLLFLMGRRPGEPIEVARDIPVPDQTPIDAARAVDIAVNNRLDLQRQREQRDETERHVRYTRNQLLPQFDLNLSLTRRRTTDSLARSFGLDGFQFATFFTIAMPVDRTAQQIDYQNAVTARARYDRELATREREIGDEVRRALRERDRLSRGIIASDMSVELARREVAVAQLRYERGLSNNLDVVAAESSLLLAESRRITALADAAVARLRLRMVLGVFSPRVDLEEPGTTLRDTLGVVQ